MLTVINCSNCNKELKRSEREYCDKTNSTECVECHFHVMNGTRTISEYNKKWLQQSVQRWKDYQDEECN